MFNFFKKMAKLDETVALLSLDWQKMILKLKKKKKIVLATIFTSAATITYIKAHATSVRLSGVINNLRS